MSLPKWVEDKRTFMSAHEGKLMEALSIAWEALESLRYDHPISDQERINLNLKTVKEALRKIEELGK